MTFKFASDERDQFIEWALLPGCFPVIGGGGSGKSFFAVNIVNAINAEANMPVMPAIPGDWTPSMVTNFSQLSLIDTNSASLEWMRNLTPHFGPNLETLKSSSVVQSASRRQIVQYFRSANIRAFYFELNEPVGSAASTRLQDIISMIGSGVFQGCAVVIDSFRLQSLLGTQLMSGAVPRDSIIGPMTPLTTLGQRTGTTIIPIVNLARTERVDTSADANTWLQLNYTSSIAVGGALELSTSGIVALHSVQHGVFTGAYAGRLSNGRRLSESGNVAAPGTIAAPFYFGSVPSFYLR
jgi:hypothetical protein